MASIIDKYLDSEVSKSPPMANLSHHFKNEMGDPSIIEAIKQNQEKDTDKVYIYDDSIIEDDKIPKSFKASGAKIKREVTYLNASFNKRGRLTLKNKYGITTKKAQLGGRYNEKTDEIVINTCVLVFDKKNLEAASNNPIACETLSRLKARHSSKGSLSTLRHELKHALNQRYLSLRKANPKSKKMGLYNVYRLLEDDEKSAKLEETFALITKYFETGEDLFIFENTNGHLHDKVGKIWNAFNNEGKSEEDCKVALKEYFSNPEQIAKDSAAFWDKRFSKFYKSTQFRSQMSWITNKEPIHKIGFNNSTDDPEYMLRRKLMYTYEYYNPKTQKKERINLASKVPHTKISALDKLSFLEPIMNIATRRLTLALIPNYKKRLEAKIDLSWKNRKEDSKKYFKPKRSEERIIEAVEKIEDRLKKLIKRVAKPKDVVANRTQTTSASHTRQNVR